MEVLSRIGVGAASIDTAIPSATVTAGEPVNVETRVTGGKTTQDVADVRLALATRYVTDDGYRSAVVTEHALVDATTIEPDDDRTFETTIDIPHATPVTLAHTDVWAETSVDANWTFDPEDDAHLRVEPDPRLDAVLDAFDALGFGLRHAEPTVGRRADLDHKFVQTFDFRPHDAPFDVTGVELTARPDHDELAGVLTVDQNTDTANRITIDDAENAETRLRETIRELA